jgi:Sulfatase-modifying factor enzyme 1
VAQSVSRTIAFHGAYVSSLGAILVVLGGVFPVWSVYYRTQSVAARVEFVGGQLRPAMITLPPMADGTTVAIAETEVTQLHFQRVLGGLPRHVARQDISSWQGCPAPFNRHTLEMPVTCVTPAEAASYADSLTAIENRIREIKGEIPLTLCYHGTGVLRSDPGCTGYRLPTVEEWNYAAKTADDQVENCRFSHLPDCPDASLGPRNVKDLAPSRWFLYNMYGNAAEIVISESDNDIRTQLVGGSWKELPQVQLHKNPVNPSSAAGFRILRKLSR